MKQTFSKQQLSIMAALAQNSTEKEIIRRMFGPQAAEEFGVLSPQQSTDIALDADGNKCYLSSSGDYVKVTKQGIQGVSTVDMSGKVYTMALSVESLREGDAILRGNDILVVTAGPKSGSPIKTIRPFTGDVIPFYAETSAWLGQAYVPVLVSLKDGMELTDRVAEDQLFTMSALTNYDNDFLPFKMALMMKLAGVEDDIDAAQTLVYKLSAAGDVSHLSLFLPNILGLPGAFKLDKEKVDPMIKISEQLAELIHILKK